MRELQCSVKIAEPGWKRGCYWSDCSHSGPNAWLLTSVDKRVRALMSGLFRDNWEQQSESSRDPDQSYDQDHNLPLKREFEYERNKITTHFIFNILLSISDPSVMAFFLYLFVYTRQEQVECYIDSWLKGSGAFWTYSLIILRKFN